MAEETLTESTETTVNTNEQATPAESEQAEQANNGSDELAKMKADMAKLKAALDNATREAGNYRKQLRAKQSAEEIAAEEQKAQDEAKQKRLEELEREISKINTVKSVMSKLGTDESVSGKIAEYLYGAEDADAALTELQRYWTAKEKALRLEYGKIPAPGVGGANGEDTELQKAINLAKEIGRERAQSGKSLREQLGSYIR